MEKELMGRRGLIQRMGEETGIVDSTAGKFTGVSLITYYHSSGVIMRSPGEATLVGYCIEPPREVLESAFGDYHVTRYNGYDLFSMDDFESTTPMLGLGISPVEPPKVYGIDYNGRLEDLLQFDELLKAKREDPIASRDVQRIIDHLQADPNYEVVMYPQAIHDKREIVDVVKRFF